MTIATRAEYVRRLVARDLRRPETKIDLSTVFDLGASDVARNQDAMLAEAFVSTRRKPRRRAV